MLWAPSGEEISLPDILQAVTETAMAAVEGEAAIFGLWDESESCFVERTSCGQRAVVEGELRPLLTQNAANKVVGRQRSTTPITAAYDLPAPVGSPNKVPERSIIAMPLGTVDTVIGIIYLVHPGSAKALSSSERRMLTALADQTAVAVKSVQQASALALERQKIESILEHSADGIMTVDPERRIHSFSPGMERLTGWPRKEALGKYCFEVLRVRDEQGTELCQSNCPVALRIEGFAGMIGRLATRDGTDIDVGMNYSVTRSPDGEVDTTVVNIRDIGNLRQVEELRESILNTVSHQLQTPISIIKAFANALSRPEAEWSKETVRDKLKAIEEESDRLAELVSKLLLTSRLDSGTVSINRLQLDLSKEAQKAARRFAETIHTHTVEVDFPETLPPVLADPESIYDVISNLVTNAIKFSPNGGRITVRGSKSEKDVSIAVIDEGIGIPPHDQELVFDRFYRVDNSLVRTTRGTGLGLYICRTLIEAQGGHIWVESGPGKGSCLIFTLPIVEE